MELRFFDAHTHVQFAAFETDYKEVIARALDLDVGIINIGTQQDTSVRAVEIANEYENGVYATVGLHPIHTEKSYHDEKELGGGEAAREFTSRGEEFDYDFYKKMASDSKILAIGECGLDYYRLGEETKERQAEAFIKQVELAKEVGKPLMIHCRDAFDDLIKILITNYQLLISERPGIIHFFSGNLEDAKKLLEMGFSFTFGGVITFPSKAGQPRADARDYDEVIKMIPMDRILSETDAPYVAPAPYRGKRNEPLYVIEVVKKLAEIKGIEFEKMRERILENTEQIFKLNKI